MGLAAPVIPASAGPAEPAWMPTKVGGAKGAMPPRRAGNQEIRGLGYRIPPTRWRRDQHRELDQSQTRSAQHVSVCPGYLRRQMPSRETLDRECCQHEM